MAFIYICSLFLFNITFSGNSNLTTPVLTRYLESIGVKNGCRTACIDCNDIEKRMREDFDEITWVAAAVKGNHLYISIKENDSFEGEIKSTEIPENIIASDDGTIESIITRSGTPLVKKGDNVEKGQVLVSGVVNICDDSGEVIAKRGVTADADVLIKTEMIYSDELSEKYENKVFTGKTRVNAVIRFGKYIISIGPGVVFCASSRMIKALSSVRPRIYASGATSISPFSIFAAKLSAPII
jgi:similar to stage IV sporulation protein